MKRIRIAGAFGATIGLILTISVQAVPAEAAGPCTAVTLSAAPPSPAAAGSNVTFTGAATGCDIPEYEFWVQAPGSGWQLLQAYSPSPTATWSTSGLLDATYLLDLWVRQTGSSADWEAHLSPNATYTLGPPCTSVTLTANPPQIAARGTTVTFTGQAAGCPNPEYEFWLQPPGATWQLLQAYSASTSANWDTTSFPNGTYLLDVWARQSGALNEWEAHLSPNPTYAIGDWVPCTSAQLNSSPDSPQATGTTITFSASSTGCSAPTYEFWIQPPGGVWQVLQPYSAAATATWDTTGKAPGVYLLDVWARQDISQAQYEAHLSPNPTYVLTAPACSGVTLATSPGSPQVPGTQVTLTAAATGCPNPEFQFTVQPPGGVPTPIGPYSSASGVTWNTTGLAPGTYLLDVYARQSGSKAAYETHLASAIAYVLTRESCASVALKASPPSPQEEGAVVTFSATATACSRPEFQFRLLSPSEESSDHHWMPQVWTVVQDYGPASSWTWATEDLQDGLYLVDVFARQQGSSAPYEAHLNDPYAYSLTGGEDEDQNERGEGEGGQHGNPA